MNQASSVSHNPFLQPTSPLRAPGAGGPGRTAPSPTTPPPSATPGGDKLNLNQGILPENGQGNLDKPIFTAAAPPPQTEPENPGAGQSQPGNGADPESGDFEAQREASGGRFEGPPPPPGLIRTMPRPVDPSPDP